MTTTEPDRPDDEAFVVEQVVDIQATVQHHAPCVPECPVCYPPKNEAG